MYCLFNFPPTDRMATYYLIYERDDMDEIEIHETLYSTYEEAYEVVKGLIDEAECSDLNHGVPKEHAKLLCGAEIGCIGSYDRTFFIREMKVVPKKKPTKKYVYQYFVRNNEQTEMKSSQKYETFDEVCDVLNTELRKLHGESWEPRMTREQYKNYMGDDAYAISYDFYKTDTYVLFRTEV